MREEREDNTVYKAVVNHEEQYSIWPAAMAVTTVAERLSPSIANLRVSRRVRGGRILDGDRPLRLEVAQLLAERRKDTVRVSRYRGEILVNLVNLDPRAAFTVRRGDRIAQLVVQQVARVQFHEVDSLEATPRGDTGHGASGGFGDHTPTTKD